MTDVIETHVSQAYKAKTDWLDPINRTIFQNAFRKGHGRVKLRDNRVFYLEYFNNKQGIPVVRITPHSHLVPMGTFEMKMVLDPDWILEEKHSGK